ncbi:MAG: ComEC/Rec2 family competence protein, partial [Planctomycetaceae bacterium]
VAALTPGTRAIALALLIGDRTSLGRDSQQAFVLSGTMHMLAISGLHVGVLASMLSCACRVIGVSRNISGISVVSVIVGYVLIVGSRPSVVRAAVLVSVWMLGRPWWRQSHVWHRLSLAAIGMMLWNPLVVFDVGAQLSYLAMLALSYSQMSLGSSSGPRGDDPRSTVVRLREQIWCKAVVGSVWHYLRSYVWSYVMIWVFTAPLAANTFHVLAPIGLCTNFVLLHVIAAILVCGFLIVVLAALHPDLAYLPGVCLDAGLTYVLRFVDWSSRREWGHFEVGSLPTWWLLGHYGLLCILLFKGWRLERTRWRLALVVWLIIGVFCLCWRSSPEEFRCRFLDVGHGSAVLIEWPSGTTMLYDCGSMQGGHRAAQTVMGAMRASGMPQLDTLVISHADVDHCNGVPTLLSRVSVRRIVVGHAFWDLQQRVVRDVLAAAQRNNVAVETVSAGRRLAVDPQTRVTIIHPQRQWLSPSDNANSLVLQIAYAGRNLLLPGDVEAEGLEQLLKRPSRSTDVLMAPHHGSRVANTRRVAQWARPNWVIVSSGQHVRLEELRAIYGLSQVLGTTDSGAIDVRIRPSGQMSVDTFCGDIP